MGKVPLELCQQPETKHGLDSSHSEFVTNLKSEVNSPRNLPWPAKQGVHEKQHGQMACHISSLPIVVMMNKKTHEWTFAT